MPLRQVYQFTKSGNTNSWIPITTGDFFWNITESESDYLLKLGFDSTKFYMNEPNYLAAHLGRKNQLFQTLIFFKEFQTYTIPNDFINVVYMRIATEQQGVMFLCQNIGDSIFLLQDVGNAMNGSFQWKSLQ